MLQVNFLLEIKEWSAFLEIPLMVLLFGRSESLWPLNPVVLPSERLFLSKVCICPTETGEIDMSDEATKKKLELQSVDTNTMPWGELYIEQLKTAIPVKE